MALDAKGRLKLFFVVAEMQKPAMVATTNSSLVQFGHECQEMTKEVLGPHLMFKLLSTPLPGHDNQCPLPALFFAIHYALERKWKDCFLVKNSTWKEYFAKSMQEYEIGRLQFPQTLDLVRKAEVFRFKELCGEDVREWCYHVLRYTGLVGLHPSHGKLSRDARNGHANLLVANIVQSLVHGERVMAVLLPLLMCAQSPCLPF